MLTLLLSRWKPQPSSGLCYLVDFPARQDVGILLGDGGLLLYSRRPLFSLYLALPQAPHNTAIVRRSWGVLESADASSRVLAYGPEFRYEEFLAAKNPVYAALTSLIVYFGFAWLGSSRLFLRRPWLMRLQIGRAHV